MSKERETTMQKLINHAWCRKCDYHHLGLEMEQHLVFATNLNNQITLYCSYCGHKHEMSGLEYIQLQNTKDRLMHVEKAIENLDYGNINMWYPSMYRINRLATTYVKLDDYVNNLLYYPIDLDNVYPKGALVKCDDDSYIDRLYKINEFAIQEFLLESGLNIWGYPYAL